MKKVKRFVSLAVAAVMLFGVFSHMGVSAFADDTDVWNEGVIKANAYVLIKSDARDHVYPNRSYRPARMNFLTLTGLRIYLLNEDGDVIDSKVSGDGGKVIFDNLPEGKYCVSVLREDSEKARLSVISTARGASGLFYPLKSDTSGLIEVSPSNPNGASEGHATGVYDFPLYDKTFAFIAKTDIGTFAEDGWYSVEDDGKTRIYLNGEDYVEKSEGTDFTQFMGILYGDSASLYPNLNELEVPELNDNEKAFGYEFKGWRIEGTEEILTTSQMLNYIITEDTIFHAIFTYPTHKVTFATDTDKGLIEGKAEKVVEIEGNISNLTDIPEPEPKEGYTFVGWYLDPGTTNIVDPTSAVVTKDIIYYAKYKAADDKTETVTVHFDPDGGSTSADYTQIIDKGGKASIPETPKKEGYDFIGWYYGGAKYDFESPVNNDMIIRAYWKRIEIPVDSIKIEFDLGDGKYESGDLNQNIPRGSASIVPSGVGASNPDYEFVGWAMDGMDGVILSDDLINNLPLSRNTKFTAVYKPKDPEIVHDDVNVNFIIGADGKQTGTTALEQTIPYAASPEVPGVSANTNYAFLGWTIKGGNGTIYPENVVKNMSIIEDTTFAAVYQRITTTSGGGGGGGGGGGTVLYYVLNFDENGGSRIAPVTAKSGTRIDVTDHKPVKEGFAFDGWYEDPELTIPISEVKLTENKIVYARWVENEKKPIETPDALNSADHMKYVVGYPDGTVKPNGNITRGEATSMIYRLITAERRDQIFTVQNNFSDVSENLWFNKAVSSMARGGYVSGYPDGTFKGNNKITRAEFVTLLVNFMGGNDGYANFTDVSSDHWAYKQIATASKGLVSGYPDGTFKPDQAITRAEAMSIINRILNRGVNAESYLGNIITFPDNSNPNAWYYYEVIEATNDHEYEGRRPNENYTRNAIDYFYDAVKYERPNA